jgi:hypothetical protein
LPKHHLGGAKDVTDIRRSKPIDHKSTGTLTLSQSAVTQAGKMLRDVRLRQAGHGDDIPYGSRMLAQGEEAGEASRISESTKECGK